MAKDTAMLIVRSTVISLALAALAAGAAAQSSMTPQRYVQCQTAAHLATLAGMQERLALLRRQANPAEQRRSDETARARVDRAYASCGSSVGALGAYAYRNGEQIRAWLAANPTQQALLQSLQTRIASTGAQMGAGPRTGVVRQRRES
jgi:hypothetical protein